MSKQRLDAYAKWKWMLKNYTSNRDGSYINIITHESNFMIINHPHKNMDLPIHNRLKSSETY